jgi:hypothetical protein
MTERDLVPDNKDWTWVLQRACDECHLDVTSLDVTEIPSMIRHNAAAFAELLGGDDTWLRTRPRPDKWSPLEYGFHVRDVYELYHHRLGLMLEHEGPEYPNWDQDESALEKGYGRADPIAVAAELTQWAESLATLFETVDQDGWTRTGYRSDGAAFTVESFARYLIHDPVHHLWDVSTA